MDCADVKISAEHKSLLDKYVADGNEVVEFKLVRTTRHLEDESVSFKPGMCHQIFSQTEHIFGYERLQIRLYFNAGNLNTFLGVRFKSKVNPKLTEGVEPDNIMEKMEEILRAGHTANLDDFSAQIEKSQANFKPLGELVHTFTTQPNPSSPVSNGKSGANGHRSQENGGEANSKTYEVYYCDFNVPKFTEYLKKMETFILWFIDAASFVDSDDEKWKFFVMYEKYKSAEGNAAYAFVGYTTVYDFYCYPDMIRPRVAQMLVLPPFQRQGLGVELLSTVYRYYRAKPNVKEITVEDPSDDFERLRDFVDARDVSKLAAFSDENLRKGITLEMLEETKKVLKMTSRQARRVYEMLRLRVTNIHSENEFKEFRLDVKRRLNIPYQKQQKDIKRMVRRNVDSTALNNAAQLDDASRKTELESNFQLCLSHYQYVLNRLERDV